jgi:N-acetylmuramoyl-L-alanine amidase
MKLERSQIKDIQHRLGKVLNRSISVDGLYGPQTKKAIKLFAKLYALLPADGTIDKYLLGQINSVYDSMWLNNSPMMHFGKARFAVFVDAGHGGINDQGVYQTAGKRAKHEGTKLHDGRGNYYEGFENRLFAEAFCEALVKEGIMPIRLYHPVKDTSLSDRAEIMVSYLRRGYIGYLHSAHSNAISSSNSLEKLLRTRGFMVFTTKGTTLSDLIASAHDENIKEAFGDDWIFRGDSSDGDVDYEANFAILRKTDLSEFRDKSASFLEEFGFHTSKTDCEFITDPTNRAKRVAAAVRTAHFVRGYFLKKGLLAK